MQDRVRCGSQGSILTAIVRMKPGLEVHSLPLYGAINGFFLDQVGTYEITVQYQAQRWARLGALMTAAVLVALGPALLLLWQRAKGGPASGARRNERPPRAISS
jgi:hypothetical protein